MTMLIIGLKVCDQRWKSSKITRSFPENVLDMAVFADVDASPVSFIPNMRVLESDVSYCFRRPCKQVQQT